MNLQDRLQLSNACESLREDTFEIQCHSYGGLSLNSELWCSMINMAQRKCNFINYFLK